MHIKESNNSLAKTYKLWYNINDKNIVFVHGSKLSSKGEYAMKNKVALIISIVFITMQLTACGYNNSNVFSPGTTIVETTDNSTIATTETKESLSIETEVIETNEFDALTLKLRIGDLDVNVFWSDNESVRDLKRVAKDGLTIVLHEYGDFEQTGPLGTSIISNDEQMSVHCGDIVLYNSNQICLYYGDNNWSFTKLGHINLGKNELIEMLSEDESIVIYLFTESN